MRAVSCLLRLSVWLVLLSGLTADKSNDENVRSGRIVGGRNASIKDHPHMLLLRETGYALCGAVVIGSKYALTAAHCVYRNTNPKTISLHGGSTTQNGASVAFNVARIVMHPNYNYTTIENDLAIIETTRQFSGNTNVAPVELANTVPVITSTSSIVCNTTGWGVVNTNTNAAANTLQVARMKLIEPRTCRLQWYPNSVTTNMICARGNATDFCRGDSGGPLVCGRRLYGIASWGTSRCDGSRPAVYTNIPAAAIRKFIRSVTGI